MIYVAASFPLWVAIPLVVLLIMLLGFTIERVAYKPLRNSPRMSVMISAIGVSYLLQNLALYLTGGLAREYPEIPWISDPITFLGVPTRRVTVITPFLVIALVVALVWIINNTKTGIAMRAVAKDFETSQLMGIKINSVISTTFAVGTFLAVVGSFLFFSSFRAVFPTAGAMPGLKAFVAAVFGGIGSIPGAVLGGLLIGVVESIIKGLDIILGPAGMGIISTQLELATFSDAFTFILLVLVLVFKPTGLFGDKPTDKV
jgi:branched-chain amino acid transport system permease protein